MTLSNSIVYKKRRHALKKFVYLLTVGCAVLVLQVAMVAAQAVPNMPPPGAPGGPPPGAPGGPPPAGGAPLAEPDLDAMSDAELEALFADAPEGDAAPAPGTAPMGAPPMGTAPMGAPPMGAPPVR